MYSWSPGHGGYLIEILTMENAVDYFLPFRHFRGYSVSQEFDNSASDNEDIQLAKSTWMESAPHNNGAKKTHTHSKTNTHSLMAEVRGPAPPKKLAMTRSAICLRARSPVGLLPLVSWSWIRPSSSSLNTCSKKPGFCFSLGSLWDVSKATEMLPRTKDSYSNSVQIKLASAGRGCNVKKWPSSLSPALNLKATFLFPTVCRGYIRAFCLIRLQLPWRRDELHLLCQLYNHR